jgi:hypothetical protein
LGFGSRRGRFLLTASHCGSVSPRQAMIRLPAEQAFLGGGTNHITFGWVSG